MVWKKQQYWIGVLVAVALGLRAVSAAGADGIAGTWVGDYTCAQGSTGLSLFVDPPGTGPIHALFYFYPTADNPRVPQGCFEMSGRYDGQTREARLVAGGWLLHPFGFVTVDLSGQVDAGESDMAGAIDGPGCRRFRLHRSAGPRRLPPPACRSAADIVASLAR
jgi:hypothetical protein